ncbi:MAG TPA: NAD(P)-dependent oxidoreductase [Candidatus Binataceae bacterium]|jgi:3-hydroxyisobutyrate dehydrogenase|nr:NAD(P)-dependent oxidoreductase [Candidatus Binataceae bacterium]
MRIGFIGLGNMGGPMALNIIRAGHDVTVHDVRREAGTPHLEGGAKWADSPREVAVHSDVIMTSLPGPREVEAVALGESGIIHGARPGSIYVDLSTNSPTVIRRFNAVFKEKGVDVLDAPVSGGVVGAKKAALGVFVGGDEAAFHKVQGALSAIGDKVSYIGLSGSGAIAKLVHNQIAICTSAVIAEAFTMGVKAGVAPDALFKAVRDGAFGQPNYLNMLPRVIFKGAFDRAFFALKLARKDLGLATEVAREFDVPMALAGTVEQDLIAGLVNGLGDKDASAAFTLQEARAGIKVRNE